jgi:hypothetical protein
MPAVVLAAATVQQHTAVGISTDPRFYTVHVAPSHTHGQASQQLKCIIDSLSNSLALSTTATVPVTSYRCPACCPQCSSWRLRCTSFQEAMSTRSGDCEWPCSTWSNMVTHAGGSAKLQRLLQQLTLLTALAAVTVVAAAAVLAGEAVAGPIVGHASYGSTCRTRNRAEMKLIPVELCA